MISVSGSLYSLLFVLIVCTVSGSGYHHNVKRTVLWPNGTIFQITSGLSFPGMVSKYRIYGVNYGYQANFMMPSNLSQFQTVTLMARSVSEIDFGRTQFYNYISNFMDKVGLNGEDCLFRIICETAKMSFNKQKRSTLLGKILHYLFTPSEEHKIPQDERYFIPDYEQLKNYIYAEDVGSTKDDCYSVFCDCSLFPDK